VKRLTLIKTAGRKFKKTTQTTVTLWDLVNTVMDEAGDNDNQLVDAIIADLIQSGKIRWTGGHTSSGLHC
jgi:hypothetical protein